MVLEGGDAYEEFFVVLMSLTFLSTGANAATRPGYNPNDGYAANDPNGKSGTTESFTEKLQYDKMRDAIKDTWPDRNPTGPMPAYPNNGQESPRQPLPNNPSRSRLHFPLPENHPLRHPEEKHLQHVEHPLDPGSSYFEPKPWRYTEEELSQRQRIINENIPERARPSFADGVYDYMPVPPMPHSPVVMP